MKGIDVQLVKKTQIGTDPFGNPIYSDEEQTVTVHDCLVGQPSTDDITSTIELYGKKIAYVVGVPKGDANDWTDAEVIFFGKRFKTIGFPQEGILDNIPLRWGKNVKVEMYES